MEPSTVFLVGGPYHEQMRAVRGYELVVEEIDGRVETFYPLEGKEAREPLPIRRGRYTPSQDQPNDPVWVWLFRGWE